MYRVGPSGTQHFHRANDDVCEKYVPFCTDYVRPMRYHKCPGIYDKGLQSTALVTLSHPPYAGVVAWEDTVHSDAFNNASDPSGLVEVGIIC